MLRTSKDRRQINSFLAAFAHVWRCRGAPLCPAEVSRITHHSSRLLLPAQPTLQNLCVQSRQWGTVPRQWGAAGTRRAQGQFTGGGAKSQQFSVNEVLLGLEAQTPFESVKCWPHCAMLSPEEMGMQFLWDSAHP